MTEEHAKRFAELFEYAPEALDPKHRWQGEGPPPAHWYAEDGTKVYRSYADYCMD